MNNGSLQEQSRLLKFQASGKLCSSNAHATPQAEVKPGGRMKTQTGKMKTLPGFQVMLKCCDLHVWNENTDVLGPEKKKKP